MHELTLNFRNALALELSALGQSYFKAGDYLGSLGFESFKPFLDLEFSCCNGDDQELHRRFLIEEAREIFGSWGPNGGILLDRPSTGYRSPLINEFRASRRASGLDNEWFRTPGNNEKWRYYLSPCRIKLQKIFLTDLDRRRLLLEERNRAFTAARRREGIRFRKGNDSFPGLPISTSEPMELVNMVRRLINYAREGVDDIIGNRLSSLGFRLFPKLSSPNLRVYVREFQRGWQLQFNIRVTELEIAPQLFFCHRTHASAKFHPVERPFDPTKQMEIRFTHCAPFFSSAYTHHSVPPNIEIDINTQAIAALYEHFHSRIVAAIDSCLKLAP